MESDGAMQEGYSEKKCSLFVTGMAWGRAGPVGEISKSANLIISVIF